MKKKNLYSFFSKNDLLNIFFNILILFLKIEFSFNALLLNNIIELGGEGFRFSHFSLNSKGDMIIDTTSFPGNNERRFYGLKKNGRPLFYDENNIETPYRSLFAEDLQNENQQKLHAESNFIILSNQESEETKEYLLSFSIGDNYIEIYDFDNNTILFRSTSEFFGNTITSEKNTFIKSESTINDVYNYIVAYNYYDDSISNYRLKLGRIYFTSTELSSGYHLDSGNMKAIINKATASCFETELKRVVCLYQNYENMNLEILTLNENNFDDPFYTQLYLSEDLLIPTFDYNLFYKAILFRKEIGLFIYFRNITSVYPIITMLMCKDDNKFYDYKLFNLISLSKIELSSNANLNDIMKLNNDTVCYISCSSDKKTLIIVKLFFYSNDMSMSARYYKCDIYAEKNIMIYKELRGFYFNNYISVAFSHCSTGQCSEDSDQHKSSLIIFNYPNSPKDQSVDLIEYIYSTNNQIDTYTFRLNQDISCSIDNNIFNYTCKELKLLNYSETIYLVYNSSGQVVEKNASFDINEYLSFEFDSNEEYKAMNYTIEYAFVVIEPVYEMIDNPIYKKDSINANTKKENSSYVRKEYIGKSAFFNLTIKEDMTSNCNDKCSLCYKNDSNYCTICKYNYTFNDQEKICSDSLSQTTIPTTLPKTTIPTNITTTVPKTKTPSTLITTIGKITIPTTVIATIAKTTIPNMTSITTISKTSNIVSSTMPASTSISTVSKTSSTFPSTTSTSSISSSIPSTKSISSSNILQPKNTIKTSSLSSSTPSYSSIFETKSQIPAAMSSSLINANSTSLNIVNENKKCTNQQAIENKCSDIITKEQIYDIYKYIKDNLINNNTKNNNTIILTKNSAFQVSTVEIQYNNEIYISSIDLGDCENKIREKEKIKKEDELIIFKIDTKIDDLSLTYVQYEIYHPYTLQKISLDICDSSSIIIKAPIVLEDNLESAYLSLNSSGYNLFNLNDSFYSDICSTYTTQKGTDISMADRKNLIYDNYKNTTLCQSGCIFLQYDYINKKSECSCKVQTEITITDVEQLSFERQIVDSFYKTLKNSNFLVIKCYKLVLSVEGILINYGSYLMTCMTLLFIISIGSYFIKGKKFIDKNIYNFIQSKVGSDNKNDNNAIAFHSKEKKEKKKSNRSVTKNKENKICDNITINNNNINIYINNNKKKKTNYKNKDNNCPPKRNTVDLKNSKISKNNLISKRFTSKNHTNATKLKMSRDKLLTKEKNTLFNKKNINLSQKGGRRKKIKKLSKKSKKRKNICSNTIKTNQIDSMKNYTNTELNRLTYEQAIMIDHRTYFQYYKALIYEKHLLLFTFCRGNDYNLIQMKICLLIFTISLHITVNGFFFSDKSMNKIYQDNGEYDLLFQIQQILYSLSISGIITVIVKRLSLTEYHFLSLKNYNNEVIVEEATKERYQMKIRIFLFSIIGIVYMVFFWYYISCFCAVYKNTQLILIIDSLFSIGFSLIYPFGLYLLPGMFRITALRAKEKNKKCLFLTGNMIAFI